GPDGTAKHFPRFQAGKIEVFQGVFPERLRLYRGLVRLPVEFLQLRPEVNRRPGVDDEFILAADAFEFTGSSATGRVERERLDLRPSTAKRWNKLPRTLPLPNTRNRIPSASSNSHRTTPRTGSFPCRRKIAPYLPSSSRR